MKINLIAHEKEDRKHFVFIQKTPPMQTVNFPSDIFIYYLLCSYRVSLCEDSGYDEFVAELPHFSTERI